MNFKRLLDLIKGSASADTLQEMSACDENPQLELRVYFDGPYDGFQQSEFRPGAGDDRDDSLLVHAKWFQVMGKSFSRGSLRARPMMHSSS